MRRAVGVPAGCRHEASAAHRQWSINYRVADLRALLQALRSEGCTVFEKTEESEFGTFGWVLDPEGNKVDWELPPGQ